MKKHITTKELVAILGMQECTTKDWRADRKYKDMKISAVRGKRMYYNLEKLLQWMIETGRAEYAEKIAFHISQNIGVVKNKPEKKQEEKTEVPPPDTEEETPSPQTKPSGSSQDMDIFVFRRVLRGMVGICVKEVQKKMNSGEPKTAEINSLINVSKLYADIESRCIEMDMDLKKVVLFEDVKQWNSRAFSKFKTHFQSLAYSVADQLENKPAQEIAGILKTKIDDSFRSLYDSLQIGGK